MEKTKYVALHHHPDEVLEFIKHNLEMARRLPELTAKYGCAVTNIVLGYFTQEQFPCVPLYGPMNEASIVEAAKTFDIKFDKEDYNF